MKILLVNVTCKQGSTGKIVYDLYTELRKEGHEGAICYGRGSTIDEPHIYKFTRNWEVYLHALKTRLTGYVGRGNAGATRRLIRYIQSFQPDVVHLHNIHGYYVDAYKLLLYLKQSSIHVVFTMHDEWIFTGKCGYPNKCEGWRACCGNCPQLHNYPKSMFFDRSSKELEIKKEIFSNFNAIVFTPVVAWLRDAAKQSAHLMDKRFQVVHNGIDLSIFKPVDAAALRTKLDIRDEKILLHVTPDFNNPRKGGQYVLDLAQRLENKPVKFIIVGADKPQGNASTNIIWIPQTEDQQELAAYYTLADFFVLTSEEECLPTVCLEALCCGTPVIGFGCDGAKEATPERYGAFVEYGDIDGLERLACDAFTGDLLLAKPEQCADYAHAHYDKKTMTRKYLEIYQKGDL